ncbi:glycosyl transferase group 1 [Chloroherpeton thalassium ATCC 35110]|uniref:Glycosyl transferase group 1 n=1 Tax=Chloroherpeton thalassium (strain ATCC 35110 / GB-78) TaxID=517418 RepID=B3QU59_CHLT3|nr:glycosyltransferase family 1 protein [Chloroherpeton thalassium]ACF12857.1 glycosyl transferase group 1 [Chloroherpeton thalassium ATCC 35110]
MNIVMVSCQHFTSGIGNYAYELAKHVRAENPELSLFKVYKPGHADSSFHEQAWIHPIPYKSFRDLHPYILPLFIRKALGNTKADIYHAHWFLSGLALGYALGRPAVVTMHDVSLLHIKEASATYEAYYKWALERFQKKRFTLVMVSETAKQDAVKYAGYPENLIEVVPNGINQQRFYPLPTEAEDAKKAHFRIIYSGGLGKRKNLELLFNAYKLISQKHSDVELVIAGAYPERTAYPQIARDMALKNVRFTGYLPDEEMNAFYNSGDLLIYTSLYEGFGFAPLEAMAAGVPVITTSGGSLKEISGGGGICTDYDEHQISEAANELIASEAKRRTLIEKGRNWVQQYTWEKAAEKTLSIFKNKLS